MGREWQIDPYSSPTWHLFFTRAGNPVNILDEQNWDQYSAGAPCAYTGFCITTIPACKVGQNIYLGIICLQVHTVLKYPALGRGLDVWGAGIVTFGITLQHLHALMHLQRISGTSLDFPWYLLPCAVLVREVKLDQVFFFFSLPSSFLHLLLCRLLPFLFLVFVLHVGQFFSQAGEVNDITTYDHKNKWHQMVCVCSLMYIWGNLLPPGGETVAL